MYIRLYIRRLTIRVVGASTRKKERQWITSDAKGTVSLFLNVRRFRVPRENINERRRKRIAARHVRGCVTQGNRLIHRRSAGRATSFVIGWKRSSWAPLERRKVRRVTIRVRYSMQPRSRNIGRFAQFLSESIRVLSLPFIMHRRTFGFPISNFPVKGIQSSFVNLLPTLTMNDYKGYDLRANYVLSMRSPWDRLFPRKRWKRERELQEIA